VRLARKEKVEPVLQYSGIVLVTRENLDAYLAQWRRWEQGE